ncbi:putative zinc finger protein 250-like [Scophthalmus maximus]|uniref:Putative zinc finger protein 250-like n=1 Tax=Scophthalmus maximus TaxID=52904 RepID=A0A2U9AVY0_SCOMX|nr:putative zinc finger protein 250-like [Scophthalmus maximus]
MEPSGPSSRADGDFLAMEPDEELLCSVGDITEHLGRNITVVLETALSEIRKMVSIRIRVLKTELRDKTEEVDALRARLDTVQRDGRDHFPGGATSDSSAEAGHKRPDGGSGAKHGNADPRRVKTIVPGVKKENIDAICDYLMKDKNSRGGPEMDGDHGSQTGDREMRQEQDAHSLNLWPDSGMAGSESGHGDSESTTDDIFAMLPSGSKRMYDYEWITPIEYSSDLKAKLKYLGYASVAMLRHLEPESAQSSIMEWSCSITHSTTARPVTNQFQLLTMKSHTHFQSIA